jgi:hypothetical protein
VRSCVERAPIAAVNQRADHGFGGDSAIAGISARENFVDQEQHRLLPKNFRAIGISSTHPEAIHKMQT